MKLDLADPDDQRTTEGRAVKVELRPPATARPASIRCPAWGPKREWMPKAFAQMAPAISSIGVYILRNCEIRGLAIAYLDGQLVNAPDLIPSYVEHSLSNINISSFDATLPIREVDGQSVVFVSNAYLVYGHWLLDILPRLWIATQLYHVDAAANFILPNGTPSFALDIMSEYFGIDAFMSFDIERETLLIEEAIMPSLPHNDHFFHPIMNEFVEWLLVHPSVIAAETKCNSAPELIYITRKGFRDVSTSYKRSISNEDQVLELVESLGFSVVSPEQLSWSEQIFLFSRALIIAGEDGSGLHNAVFSPGNASVICLNPVNQVQVTIAALRNQQITVLCSHDGDGEVKTEQEVDLTRLRLAISAAAKSAGNSIPPEVRERLIIGRSIGVIPLD
ncbi:glycosyltransferase family 61 protein [Methylobacterium hispanicum]|uniref:glycosyltransferase family 61 protein n=1 Tax=Methylobacterium hispanicum TaxID=270350 RepID=UPI002F35F45B